MFISVQNSPDVPRLLGQAYLDVNFQSATASGEAGNFYSIENGATDGALTFSNGSIREFASFARLSADYSGDIAFEDKSRSVSGNVGASLTGDEGEFFVATYTGTGTDVDGNEDVVLGTIALHK